MSISTDDMDDMPQTEAGSYADHEHINLALTPRTGPGANADVFQDVEPLAGELESNQVAELVYYRRQITGNGGSFEFGLGFNVSDQDFVEQSAGNQTDLNLDAADEFENCPLAIYEEPGIIDFYASGNRAAVEDRFNDETEFAVKEIFENGPFIDSTDNLSLHLESNNNTAEDQNMQISVQMVFAIHEVAQGVPRFSDPRRLMGD
jgi:hypothetical protein